jgi:hypothetical protein
MDGVGKLATDFIGDRVAETPAEYVIARPTVYLDTTIPSFLTAWPSRDAETARKQRVTHEWWNLYRWQFDVCSSRLVREEAESGDAIAAGLRVGILDDFREVGVEANAKELATKLKLECGLPEKANRDAEHVAVAAIHGLQFLLTWNYKHLANDAFRPSMMHICYRQGYTCPLVVTPDEIMRLRTHV